MEVLKLQWYIIIPIIFALLISIFAVQNPQQVTLRFLLWDLPSLSLVLVIFFSTAMGVLITILFSLTRYLRLTIRIHDLQARLKQMEKKLSQTSAAADEK